MTQINKIVEQNKENERARLQEERAFKIKIKNINLQIKKACLKETQKKLINEKEEIIIDHNEAMRIFYYCEKNMLKCMGRLYNEQNCITNG